MGLIGESTWRPLDLDGISDFNGNPPRRELPAQQSQPKDSDLPANSHPVFLICHLESVNNARQPTDIR